MKNKKGFTLIELLAVIVILAIIALIAVPVIMNILDKANKSAFKDTAYGVISAGELYFAEQQLDLNGMKENAEFTFPTDKIEVKGNVPNGTVLHVSTEGKTALAMSNGRYCITKGFEDKDITVTENYTECNIPESEGNTEKTLADITNTNIECLQRGKTCTADDINDGIKVTINVNDSQPYDFYVIADDEEKVTLIMSRNLGNKVVWISDEDYGCGVQGDGCAENDKGPITAINYLDELTDDEWSNIPMIEYTYNGIGSDGETFVYEDITRTMRARLLTKEEADTLKNNNNGTMPIWLYDGKPYWTSTADASDSYYAWYVYNGGASDYFDVYSDGGNGVRPVIELSK